MPRPRAGNGAQAASGERITAGWPLPTLECAPIDCSLILISFDRENNGPAFQTLITRIRPHRIAVLIDSNDPQWQHTCKRIIEWLSQIWGGAHSIIIPTDGKTIDHQFWTILSSFDPDEIVSYLKTNADVEVYAPTEFLDGVTALAQQWAKDNPDAGDLRGQAEETWRSWAVNDFSLSSELEGELLRRIAPFHLNEAIQIPQIKALDTPPYPYTKVIDIVEYVGAPDYVFEVVNNREPDSQMPPSLWLLSEIGITTEAYKDALAAKGIQTATKLIKNDSEFDMIKWGITPSTAFETNSPFDFTRLALRQVRANASHQYTIPSVLIVGDTITDYCLYLALSRLHGRAIWLPSWFMPANELGYPGRLMSAVNSLEDMTRHTSSRQYALISTSIENHNLRELGTVISQRMTRNTFVVEDGKSPLFIGKLVAHPLKFYAVGNMERITTHLLVDDKLPGHFESPVPSSFLSIDMYKHRWLVEVTFSQNQTPRNAVLGNYLATDPNLWAVRAAIDGLTYSCPGGLVQGSESELQMLRPSLTIPSAERIFRILLSDCGYDCLVSDKGAYEAQTIAKFGGLKQAGDALRRPQTGAFLKKYLDDSPNKEGIHDEGALLRDKRRY